MYAIYFFIIFSTADGLMLFNPDGEIEHYGTQHKERFVKREDCKAAMNEFVNMAVKHKGVKYAVAYCKRVTEV